MTAPVAVPTVSNVSTAASQPAAAPRVAASSPAPASSGAAGASLVLRLKADAWVEIRDKFREVALKRQVKAGETVALALQAPVFVYTSRADGTELQWQGKAVDLSANTQNNEVRIQIKP